MRRFLINVAMYAVFGGGLFAFAAMRGGREVAAAELAIAVAVVALWCGGLTTAIERVVPRLPKLSTRLLAGATLGAASLGGFALALGLAVWQRPVPQLIALATTVGALMQAARTFAARPTPRALPDGAEGAEVEPPLPRRLIEQGALVIDVREQREWDAGHLPSARLLPVGELPTRLAEVEAWAGGDKGRAIVVYCASGIRSGRAKELLEAAGFTAVTNGGGFGALV
ncbi:MAG: rhodanese-like domain-containing protein [Deltaproteobacteria bacterium]|nr:rhodanese-like domain-containing protein [Deltaproteobacteria bacterium]